MIISDTASEKGYSSFSPSSGPPGAHSAVLAGIVVLVWQSAATTAMIIATEKVVSFIMTIGLVLDEV